MQVYRYLFDNNRKYYADRNVISVLSFEQISLEEFKQIVQKIYDECGIFNDHYDVAQKLVSSDDRFFFPEDVHVAYIGMDEDNEDYDDKIRRFYSCKE